jgi:hypothetical protein
MQRPAHTERAIRHCLRITIAGVRSRKAAAAGVPEYLAHGELAQAEAHQKALPAGGFEEVTIANRGDVVEV